MRHRGSRIELPCPPVFYDKRFCVGDESVKLWPEQLKRQHYEVESHCNPIFVTRTIRSDMESSNNREVGEGKSYDNRPLRLAPLRCLNKFRDYCVCHAYDMAKRKFCTLFIAS
jgi:hypothetical protein